MDILVLVCLMKAEVFDDIRLKFTVLLQQQKASIIAGSTSDKVHAMHFVIKLRQLVISNR